MAIATDLTERERAELVNLYHLALTALAGRRNGRWERMNWASIAFAREHDLPVNRVYIALDHALS
jgi:hypothetical protein